MYGLQEELLLTNIINTYNNDLNIIKESLINKSILKDVLYVNKNDISISTEHFNKIIQFRKKYNPKLIKKKNIKKLLDDKSWYYAGFTKNKYPVLFCKVSNIDVNNYIDVNNVINLIVFIMGKSYKYGKLMIVYDFDDCELTVGPKILNTVIKLIKIITVQYPNFLYKCYCINCSKLFYFSYKLISSVLDKETINKIKIMERKKNNLENTLNIWNHLKVDIETTSIEQYYGGCHGKYKYL
tara:strand:- start:1550 stop:2269 length:720 start_codon:yes stop_codon:yes gene_type:complete